MRRYVLGLLALLVAGCGSSPPPGPSAAARMVCAAEAQADIAAALGVPVARPPVPTWDGGLYSCAYAYPAGSMVLGVREFAALAEAVEHYAAARAAAGQPAELPGIGRAAFAVPDGSVYVRKDAAVLHVDVRGLPVRFGAPPHPRAVVAITVATAILHCWIGDGA